jgi:tryptophan synthase alpha chain
MNQSNARLAATFQKLAGRTALIPYITAGDPLVSSTPALMHALVRAGADVIELGVPFSDPMADGPVIQRAGERAIAAGVGLVDVLDIVAEFRRSDADTPVVLMGYANPIECMGREAFVLAAAQAGVDGVLVVDYTPEEAGDFTVRLGEAGVDPIFLLAPTSTEARMRGLASIARGYVYYVSLKGVTGAGNLDTEDVRRHLELIRRHISIPVGVGFGIRDAQSAQRLAECADAVVIGSKLIEVIEDASGRRGAGQAIEAAAQWLGDIHQALMQVEQG